MGNTGSIYAGIKEASGPCATKSVPLKIKSGEPITNQQQQMERWVEHYLELYPTQNVVSDTAFNAIPDLPALDKLDTEPTEEEMSKAIDCLSTGKAPGEDSIPPRDREEREGRLAAGLTRAAVCVRGSVRCQKTCATPR